MSQTLSELTERLAKVSDTYAQKCEILRDDDWYLLKLQEELGELVAEYLRSSGRGRMKDMSPTDVRTALEDETADVLASILLFAQHNKIDIEKALERKWFRYLKKSEPST